VVQIRHTDIVYRSVMAILHLYVAIKNPAQHCGSSPAGACIDCSLAGLSSLDLKLRCLRWLCGIEVCSQIQRVRPSM
jgi:hypothetical protein